MPRRRRRGEGSVFEDRINGVWVARVSLGVREGKRVGRKVTAPTRKAAERELDRLLRAYSQGGDPATMTLDAYLSDWLGSHGPSVRESTRTSYEGHIRLHISPLLGGIIVARLRPADVERLIADRLGTGLAPASVQRIITTLRIALQAAVRKRSLPDNVAALVDLPRVPDRAVKAMTDDELDAIEDATRETFLGPVVSLLRGSGMRLGEALGLDQGDLHLESGFVTVRRTKTRIRAVAVSDDAAASLRQHLATVPRLGANEPVFFAPRGGGRLSVATVSHALPRMLSAAGLPRITPHGLRHGAATVMVARGVPMRHVAEQLGHRNPALTAKVYAHVLPESQREAVKHLQRRTETR